MSEKTLVQDMLSGSRRALARLLTYAEDGYAPEMLAELFPHTGKAWVIGITGAPGAGKSSLVNALAKNYRAQGKTLAIVAVDPTSPFSGGAILGDRIRMQELSGDKGVFIRSMATRGSLGGVARTTRDVVRVLDSAGFDYVMVETVGAGQSEVDIVQTADTTLVIEAPGMGDDVQAIKAGILEIADVLVVNKADRVGANQTTRALKTMLELGHPASKAQLTTRHHGQWMTLSETPRHAPDETLWLPPVLQTVATHGTGIDALREAIEAHRAFITVNPTLANARKHRYITLELQERLQHALLQRLTQVIPSETWEAFVTQVATRQTDPQTIVQEMLKMAYNQS